MHIFYKGLNEIKYKSYEYSGYFCTSHIYVTGQYVAETFEYYRSSGIKVFQISKANKKDMVNAFQTFIALSKSA